MHASVRSVRLAPKKANLMAKMVRGMRVPDAVELLSKTTKKSARIFETLLRSAIANAQHNMKQDPQTLIVKTVIVNQGTAYQRGVPKARGSVRPIRKFLSHIEIRLGVAEIEKKQTKQRNQKKQKKISSPSPASSASSSSSK